MPDPPGADTPEIPGTGIADPPGNASEKTVAESTIPGAALDRGGAISTELRAIRDRAEDKAVHEGRRAQWWSSLYFVIGLPAAVLATIAGATALASTTSHVAAGVIALTSAGLTGTATFLDSKSRRSTHENLAAAWKVLANDIQVRLIIDIRDDAWLQQSARLYLQELLDRERKLLQGKAPDSEAEAERRAQAEAVRAQDAAARAETEAERARIAERQAQIEARKLAMVAARIDPAMADQVLGDIETIDRSSSDEPR